MVGLGSVVRRRLRVMFTTTTLDDIATASPISAAAESSSPSAAKTAIEAPNVIAIWIGTGPQHRRVLAPQLTEVDLDTDLEQQQDRADLAKRLTWARSAT
jgi:hypothetical protein